MMPVELHTADGHVLDPTSPETELTLPIDYEPTIPVLMSRAVARFGENPCIVTKDRTYSFAEIDAASKILARHLLKRGVGKGTRVGMLFPQGPEWAAAFLGAARVGALVMPFSTFYKPAELARSMLHGDVEHLILPHSLFGREMYDYMIETAPSLAQAGAERAFVEDLPYFRSATMVGKGANLPPWIDAIDLDDPGAGDRTGISHTLLSAVEKSVTPADLLMTIYTSGTTSAPKGVVHTHGSQIRHAANLSQLRSWPEDCRIFAGMPFFWVGGLTHTLLPAIHAGSQMITQPKFEANEALDLIEEHKPTHILAWPHILERLLAHPSYANRDFSAVAFLPSSRRAVFDYTKFHGSLGMTETSGPHTLARNPAQATELLADKDLGSMGPRVPYVQHRIADPVSNASLPPGIEGEVCVRGYSVMVGLYKQEREHVFDADGWYHTGDRGYFRDDGLLFFGGRANEMIKTSGSNVSPFEVESELVKLPGVKAAFVFGLSDTERGQTVVAGFVSDSDPAPKLSELKTALTTRLSTYKVPQELIELDPSEVPTLGSGKPDRLTIRAHIAAALGRDT